MKDHILCRINVADQAGELKRHLLLPDGKVKSANGWDYTLDDEHAAHIINKWEAHGAAIRVDYEHASTGERNAGVPYDGRAAGWVEKLEYVKGEGLIGWIKWTDRARQLIQADEFRYLSPTFAVDKRTRRIEWFDSVGLVNAPALPNMPRVAASRSMEAMAMADEPQGQAGQESPQEIIAEIKALLKIEVDGDILEVLKAIRQKARDMFADDDGDAEVASSVRNILELPENASAGAVRAVLNSWKSCADRAGDLADVEVREFLMPYVKNGVLDPKDKGKPYSAYDDMFELAKSNRDLAKLNLDRMVSMMPKPGRTTPPGFKSDASRETIIRSASRDYDDSLELQKLCEKHAYVNNALREKKMVTLHTEEIERLS